MPVFGVSTYSLNQNIQAKTMNVLDVIRYIGSIGAEHVEIVPIGFSLENNDELIADIRKTATEAGVQISNYAIGASFLGEPGHAEREVERVKREVDVAALLGVKLMRHDVAWLPIPECTISRFEETLPLIVQVCQEIADYAADKGITTSIENHGYLVQGADRVQRVLTSVNRPNFKTTLDIGNFVVADENPVVSTRKNLPYASMVHFKDFYLRKAPKNPGQGFGRTAGGNYYRGSIIGQGDIDIYEVVRAVKENGYDGFVSVEFEGMEECTRGTEIGLANLRRIWDEVQ